MHFHVLLAIGLLYNEEIHTNLLRRGHNNWSEKHEDKR